MDGVPAIEILWLVGVSATILVFVAGRYSGNLNAIKKKAALPFGILGALTLLVAIVSVYRKGDDAGQRTARGTARELVLDTKYEMVPGDINQSLYLKLKGPDGEERIYAIDQKLLALPSFDRFMIPIFMKNGFKLKHHEKLILVPEDPPKPAPAPPSPIPSPVPEKK